VNPDDKAAEEKFKEVNEANEVLSDPEKRKKYDEMLAYYEQYGRWPGATGPVGRESAGFDGGAYQYRTMNEEELADLFGDQSPFSDFFETFFGSRGEEYGGFTRSSRSGRTAQSTRGQDIESAIEVTFAEAYQGATRTLELTELDGSLHRLEVKIPAGVDDGSRLRIAGHGAQGTAGRGDLYLRVHIAPDSRFTREGTTLTTTVEVPLAIAVLGGEVQVPTPAGRKLLLNIPAETANGRTFRLRGRGLPVPGQSDNRGDLYAKVTVVLPTNLSDEQRDLFAAFARSIGYDK
jgi:curved DNA-binding protein